MKKLILLTLGIIFVGGFFYLFFPKPAPQKYLDLIIKEEPFKEVDPINILFIGDIMLDRGIRNVINKKGFDYILEDVSGMFLNRDLIIGNLEGTITENQSLAVPNNQILRFTFSTTTASDLKRTGFSGFSLANNHTSDFYQAGYEETLKNLSEKDLFSFGSALNTQNLSYESVVKDKKLCFIGYHSLYNASSTNVINEIHRLDPRCDYLTVFAHWGEEYEDFENEDQKSQAHSFIDAGADVVIGHHPHVIQPIEIYKNKAIFYSLGNFIFDQDFSLETRQGIGVELSLEDNSETFKIIPIEMYKGKLYFPTGISFKGRIDILASKFDSSMKNSFVNDGKIQLIDR